MQRFQAHHETPVQQRIRETGIHTWSSSALLVGVALTGFAMWSGFGSPALPGGLTICLLCALVSPYWLRRTDGPPIELVVDDGALSIGDRQIPLGQIRHVRWDGPLKVFGDVHGTFHLTGPRRTRRELVDAVELALAKRPPPKTLPDSVEGLHDRVLITGVTNRWLERRLRSKVGRVLPTVLALGGLLVLTRFGGMITGTGQSWEVILYGTLATLLFMGAVVLSVLLLSRYRDQEPDKVGVALTATALEVGSTRVPLSDVDAIRWDDVLQLDGVKRHRFPVTAPPEARADLTWRMRHRIKERGRPEDVPDDLQRLRSQRVSAPSTSTRR